MYYMIKCALDEMGAITKIIQSNAMREAIVSHSSLLRSQKSPQR